MAVPPITSLKLLWTHCKGLLRSKRIAVMLIRALKRMICINSYNNRMKLLDDRTSRSTPFGYCKK